ncbi:hypothetical protein [Methyloceanibacter caenitepidi]|uniref:Uncharacterized protein n=1 Tax=Methyloceanibacter caenitepidi TaxID=1384459 RepID=A0A0A8K337_9HYPH|nr:hypothetical protein [Methyloceanibacter caenitepidi]BAQ16937.1 hypothetical protein GL4_1481 [Methyloceanibacter caenitepidi]
MTETKKKPMTKDELIAENGRLAADLAASENAVAGVSAELREARGSIVALKEKLLQMQIELAKAQGYRERVDEDDAVREELIGPPPTVDFGPNPKYCGRDTEPMPVPKRRLVSQSYRGEHEPERIMVDGCDTYGDPKVLRKSWVNL